MAILKPTAFVCLIYLLHHFISTIYAAGETPQTSELKIVRESGDVGPSADADPPSYDQQQILLGIALGNKISELSGQHVDDQPMPKPFSTDGIAIESLESIHKLLDVISTVALDELVFQRRIDKFECRNDLRERLQPHTELVKQIFTQILHDDIAMTNLLVVDGGVNSLKLLFSFAVRLAAAVGGTHTNMRAFLTAYSCLKNISNSADEEKIYAFPIEPRVGTDGSTNLIRLEMKEFNEGHQKVIKSNFKFLQQLATEVLTPQDVVNLCQKIDKSVGRGGAMVGKPSTATKIFSAVAAHFAASSSNQQPPVQHWEESTMLCAMSTFGDNLLKRIVANANFQKYFDAICANRTAISGANKISNHQKVLILHRSLIDFRRKYCATVEANGTKRDDFNFHEKFVDYANAIFIDWNPWRELIHTVDNVRSKLISEGVFRHTFNYNAKEAAEFQKTIDILQYKFVEGQNDDHDDDGHREEIGNNDGLLVDKVKCWQDNVATAEKAGTEVLNELEKIRAKFDQKADEFDQSEMMF